MRNKSIHIRKRYRCILFSAVFLILLAGCSSADAVKKAADEMGLDYYADGEILDRDEAEMALREAERTAREQAGLEEETEETEEETEDDPYLFQNVNRSKEDEGNDGSGAGAEGNTGKKGQKNIEDGETPQDGPTQENSSSGNQNGNGEGGSKNTVTISIRCDTAVKKGMAEDPKWAGIVPADGTILAATKMSFDEGDTVFDILCDVRDTYKLHMSYRGTGGAEYIDGMNNLYEFDGGRWSGWMYCVNGWYPNYGCGQYACKSGDVIEWNYTCDLGKDLGQDWLGEDWTETHE